MSASHIRSPGTRSRRLLVAVAALTMTAVVWINLTLLTTGFPVDFLVYREAATAALHGADLYAGNLYGPMLPPEGLPFTYPPIASVLLLPTALFDWHTAFLLWSAASAAVVAWVVWRVLPVDWRDPKRYAAALLAAGATAVVGQHLHFGQINLFLMGLVLTDLFRKDDTRFGRVLPRGLLVGVATAIKLTPGLFLVFFLLSRQWRLATWAAVGTVGATLLGALIHPGMSMEFWTNTILSLRDRVDLDGMLDTSGNNSITGILSAIGGPATVLTLPAMAAAAVGVLWTATRTHRAGRSVDAWLIVGLGATLISPISWIHHWVYLIPAGVMLTHRYRRTRAIRVVAPVVLLSLIAGPGAGELLLRMHQSVLVGPALIQRECLFLAAVLAIVLLARAPIGSPTEITAAVPIGRPTATSPPVAVGTQTQRSEDPVVPTPARARRAALP